MEHLSSARRVKDIFENGSNEEVQHLLELEKDPEVSEEHRKIITRVREHLEKNHHHLGKTESGNYRTDRTPNLSETEWNKD